MVSSEGQARDTEARGRFQNPFAVGQQPKMIRQAYRHEIVTASLYPVGVSMLEGGVVGVLSKTIFDTPDIGFAAIFAAPMFANLTSMFWMRWSRGRSKSAFVGWIMCAILLLVAGVALLPTAGWGPTGLVVIVVLGRCLLAGMLTARSAMWRANYPRKVRAKVIGRFVLIASVIFAVLPIGMGRLLDWYPWSFRVMYPVAALVALVGALSIFKVRVRGERSLLKSELSPHTDENMPLQRDGRPHTFRSVLRDDANFRSYMTWQFVAGTAQMGGMTAFVLYTIDHIKDRPDANTLGMLLTSTVPLALASLTLPLWSPLLDRMHVARYRVWHGLTWIAQHLAAFFAAMFGLVPLFFVPQAINGVMRGGGLIAWQLGHNDFSDRRLTALYMGIHQTLTGVRGLFAPFVGVWLMRGWSAVEVAGVVILPAFSGIGKYVFLVAAGLSLIAWLGFLLLSLRMRSAGHDTLKADG